MKLKRTVKSIPGPAILLVLLACFSLSSWSITAVQEDNSQNGRVYVLTNQAPVNTVVVLHRAEDGVLTKLQEVPTGGSGQRSRPPASTIPSRTRT